jgi:hypothetical protein
MTIIDPATGGSVVGRSTRQTRRWLVSASVGTGALAVAGIGFAYWSLTGSGQGSATVADGAGQFEITAEVTGELHPGSTNPVTYTVNNPSDFDAHIGTISLAPDGFDTGDEACLAEWFELDPVLVYDEVAASDDLTFDGALQFLESGVNQDACKGATITFDLVSD